MRYLIAGLGNPDPKYEHTRHNAGFDALDILSEKYDIPIKERKMRSLIGIGRIEGKDVILAKPQTYMNLSGEAVRRIMDYYDIPPENLIVLSDDIHLETGTIRVRGSGSAGGHNGLKNIIQEIGSMAFRRIRIGVGLMPENFDQIRFVLSRLTAGERKFLDQALEFAADAASVILTDGVDRAMNLYNGKKAV
ncbi:MAG: aminoacyl-tRNA hydrolase [Lachnospiraceae bacterium]|nr:aminoacyl-tRNA hydrolase [Lachnospiraceae bacterium]